MKPEKTLVLIALAMMLLIAGGDAFAADATVTAFGKFAFRNPETGVATGIRHARIEMCDEDGFGVCSVFASGETADDGRFSLSGRSGDWFGDLPEVEVRVYATSAGVEVSNGAAVYCFKTPTRQNVVNGSTIDFGVVTPQNGYKCTFGESASGENGAWAAFQWSSEAFDFLRGSAAPTVFSGLAGIPGQGLSQQKVKWPADTTLIYADFRGFEIKQGDEAWAGKVMTPYTIVAITRRLGAWDTNYNDWDGYFAHAFAAMVAQQFGHSYDRICSSADPNFCGTLEDPPHTVHDIGGMSLGMSSMATYWDLYDPASGTDHDGNGTSDQLQVPLDVLWSVMRDYDPNPGDANDNHASNIQQFGQGLLARMPNDASRIRAIYDENHLQLP